MNEMDIITYSLGTAFFMIFLFAILAYKSPYSRVRLMRIYDPKYGISEIDLDTTNFAVAIVKTTDQTRMYGGNGYRIIPSAFKMVDGIPIIRHHFSSPEPAFLRPYSAVQYVNKIPTGVTGKAEVEVEQWYQGAKKPVKEKQEVDLQNVSNLQVTSWSQELGELKTYEPISTPEEFGAFLILKDAEAEAKAILMKMQQLEKMQLIMYIVAGLAVLGLILGYVNYDKIGTLEKKIDELRTQSSETTWRIIDSYNRTYGTRPIPLSNMNTS